MSLEVTLNDITARLRQGRFLREQADGRARPPGALRRNCINRLRCNRIRLAAEVAGLTFGKDVIVEF